jgi:type II secretory pathway predicted ATPase ExeA
MDNKRLLSLYGLKWNPFSAELPPEALIATKKVEHFCWRVETLVLDGGFALVTGDSGYGKSVALRQLAVRLGELRDVTVAEFARPQSGTSDFYRELGTLFGVELKVSNRYGGFKALREKWQAHITTTLCRPVLLIDEAQEMLPAVLCELRLLSSLNFDSRVILTVVLCGDRRLSEKLKLPELIPLGTRLQARLTMEPWTREELTALLTESIKRAGGIKLMIQDLMTTLVEHAAGSPRILMGMANTLLMEAAKQERKQLDEKLYLEAFATDPSPRPRKR